MGEPERVAPDDAVLLVEGVFLMRQGSMSIGICGFFWRIDVAQTLERGVERDLTLEDPALRASKRADQVQVYEEVYPGGGAISGRSIRPGGRRW
ncbi:MAG: hypothetical protein U0841_26550 [Chloroflexia bacterium]